MSKKGKNAALFTEEFVDVDDHAGRVYDDYTRAEQTMEFMEAAVILDGAPMRLFPWQRQWMREVLVEDGSGNRKITNSLMTLPRKNGKTGIMSGLVPAFLAGPLWAPNTEIACAATTKEQADLLLKEVKKVILNSPVFMADGSFKIFKDRIVSETFGSSIRSLSSRESANHGLGLSAVFLDEYALLKDGALYDTLNEAGSTRPGFMMFAFSTQDRRADNPMIRKLKEIRSRQENGIPCSEYHIVEFKADLDKDPNHLSEANIRAANPSLDYLPNLRKKLKEEGRASRDSSENMARWLRTRLNIAGASDEQFVDPVKWKECARPKMAKKREKWKKKNPITLGVDLSRTTDLTSISEWHGDHNYLHGTPVIPAHSVEAFEAKHKLPFRRWVEEGIVMACGRKIVDYEAIAEEYLLPLQDKFHVTKMRYDAWGFKQFERAMERAGVMFEVEGVRMGSWTLDGYVTRFENMVHGGVLRHSDHPLQNFCVANTMAKVAPDSVTDVRKPTKAFPSSLIDMSVSAILAVGDEPDDVISDMSDVVW